MPIIIVEGCDGSGKTALARRLANDLSGIYIKTEVRPPIALRDVAMFDSVLQEAQRYTAFVVCDRHHAISELIYGPIIRGKLPFTFADIKPFLILPKVIYCNPGPTVIRRNMRESRQEQILERLDDLVWGYQQFFINHLHIEYNYLTHSYEDVLGTLT